MTTDITWKGTLKDVAKITDLTSFIAKLGNLVHRIYFAETDENLSLKLFNGNYSGHIALAKSFITDGNTFDLNEKQFLISKLKYKNELERKLIDTGKEYTIIQLNSDVETFFRSKVLVDRVNMLGVSFQYPTETHLRPEDIKSMSSISFVFLLEAFIEDTPLEITNENICEVWDYSDLENVENLFGRSLDYSIMQPGILVRNNSLKELFDLFNWVWNFYIKDLQVNVLNTTYKEIIIPEGEWLMREKYFEQIKFKFKTKCLDLRSFENIDYSKDNKQADWWEKEKVIEMNRLAQEFRDL